MSSLVAWAEQWAQQHPRATIKTLREAQRRHFGRVCGTEDLYRILRKAREEHAKEATDPALVWAERAKQAGATQVTVEALTGGTRVTAVFK
jgi:transposase